MQSNTKYNNQYTRSAAKLGVYFASALVGGVAEAAVGGTSAGHVAVATGGATFAQLAGDSVSWAFDEYCDSDDE